MPGQDFQFHNLKPRSRTSGAGYVETMLLPDERVVYVAGLHWMGYGSGLLLLAIGLVTWHYGSAFAATMMSVEAAALTETPMTIIASFLMGVGLLTIFFVALRQMSTELVVTNQRVIFKQGHLKVKVFEAILGRVTSLNIEQSALGSMFGFGTVMLRAPGSDFPVVEDVADPFEFYAAVMNATQSERHPERDKAALAPQPANREPGLPPPRDKKIAAAGGGRATPGEDSGDENADWGD